MRLFIGEPVWAVLNQPQEGHPTWQEYVKNVMGTLDLLLQHAESATTMNILPFIELMYITV
jgi:hypothetical protein